MFNPPSKFRGVATPPPCLAPLMLVLYSVSFIRQTFMPLKSMSYIRPIRVYTHVLYVPRRVCNRVLSKLYGLCNIIIYDATYTVLHYIDCAKCSNIHNLLLIGNTHIYRRHPTYPVVMLCFREEFLDTAILCLK